MWVRNMSILIEDKAMGPSVFNNLKNNPMYVTFLNWRLNFLNKTVHITSVNDFRTKTNVEILLGFT